MPHNNNNVTTVITLTGSYHNFNSVFTKSLTTKWQFGTCFHVMTLSRACISKCRSQSNIDIRPLCDTNHHSKTFARLTHWGRATHICVGKLTIIGSDNGLSPGRRQAIIWTSAGILLVGLLGTNFSEFQSEFKHFHSRKSIWKCRLENGGHFVSASMC